jgi:hypothetical protein
MSSWEYVVKDNAGCSEKVDCSAMKIEIGDPYELYDVDIKTLKGDSPIGESEIYPSDIWFFPVIVNSDFSYWIMVGPKNGEFNVDFARYA